MATELADSQATASANAPAVLGEFHRVDGTIPVLRERPPLPGFAIDERDTKAVGFECRPLHGAMALYMPSLEKNCLRIPRRVIAGEIRWHTASHGYSYKSKLVDAQPLQTR